MGTAWLRCLGFQVTLPQPYHDSLLQNKPAREPQTGLAEWSSLTPLAEVGELRLSSNQIIWGWSQMVSLGWEGCGPGPFLQHTGFLEDLLNQSHGQDLPST
jgi:hypothetical protein